MEQTYTLNDLLKATRNRLPNHHKKTFDLLAQGCNAQEIASILNIGLKSAKEYIYRVKSKLLLLNKKYYHIHL